MKVISVYMHVSPGIGGISGTSVNAVGANGRPSYEMRMSESGVFITNKANTVFVPFSNIVGVLVEQDSLKPQTSPSPKKAS